MDIGGPINPQSHVDMASRSLSDVCRPQAHFAGTEKFTETIRF